MIVAMVGTGTLSLHHAIPIVMGANIGTTITSTLVSLGYITSKREFRKAIGAGAIHDFYNIILTVILFPLEYYYHFLSTISSWIASWVSPPFLLETQGVQHNLGIIPVNPIRDFMIGLIENSWVLLFFSFFVLFATIKILSRIIYRSMIGPSKEHFKKIIFNNQFSAFGWGTLLTATVQSSSLTTPLIVPLVATSKISLRKAFPFVIGANIGTTVTALIAAFFNSEAAISIAVVHFLFNFTGVILFMPFTALRNIPVSIALKFGALTMRNRLYGFLYIVFTFFILPFILIYFN
jgi:sodium-dependent phosphate cotransporter